jgi:outer membrane protein
MKNTKYLVIMLLGLISFSTDAQKFGYLNTEELIISLPEVQTANTEIEALKDSLTTVGNAMVVTLREKYMALEAKAMEIAPNQLEIEKAQLQQEEAQLQEFDQMSQKQILNKSETLLAPIQARINQAIVDVAKEGEYTYIFDLSAGNVLYVDEALDVSALVKAKL